MSDSFFDKFIADLVKGAEANSRANGGPGVHILVDRENRGREEKLANQGGVGALLGGLGSGMGAMGQLGPLGGQAGAAIGAGLGADPGRGLDAAIDAGVGHSLGGMAGGALGSLLHLSPEAVNTVRQIGSTGGSMLGGHIGGKDDRGMIDRIRGKHSALVERYAAGVKAAAATFGIKEAFLGALAGIGGSIGGGMLARKALPKLTGIAGHAAEMGGSMLGGHIGSQLAPQQQQQPGM